MRKPKPNKVPLTLQAIERAPVGTKPYRIHDAKEPGLFLRVQPSGVKVYYVAYARNAAMPIGRHPTVTLTQARKAAREARTEADKHGAPLRVAAKRERRQRASGERIETLGELMAHRYAPWAKTERKAGSATVQAIKAQFSHWYGRKLVDISPWLLERFKADRIKAGVSPVTVNRDLVRLKAVLNKAVEWDLIPANPIGKVKRLKVEEDGRVRFLSEAEERRLRAALAKREERRRNARISGNRWRVERDEAPMPEWGPHEFTDHLMPLVLVAMNTGARRGELFGVTWADVSLQRKQLTVRAATSKGNRTRHIPLNAEALDALTRWHKQGAGKGYVFPGPGDGRMTNINKSWAELVKAAKLEDFRFHDCRHHFASRLVMAGVDLNTVRELLGHSDIAMTLRYAHLAPEHKAAAVERLLTYGAASP